MLCWLVLRVSELPLVTEDFASFKDRADGMEGCGIIIPCGCIVFLV